MYFLVFSIQNDGSVKTLSMKISEDDIQVKARKQRMAKNKILKLIEEIKTGKVLILISTFYLIFTLPHTIDQFLYLIDSEYYGMTATKAILTIFVAELHTREVKPNAERPKGRIQ